MNPELGEKLSALLDGELSPEEAEALRAEIARSPELAARLAVLAAVDEGLRALPGGPVPSDLRARLERRLRRGEPLQRAPRSGAIPRRAPRGGAIPRRAPRGGAIPGWLAAAAFAAAAALALVVLSQLGREETPVVRTEPGPAVEDVAPADDLPVIEVLDVLAELDELEGVGSG